MPIFDKGFSLQCSVMSTANDMLQKYIAAETAILQGQEMRFDGRMLRRADLDFIQKGRLYWQRIVDGENRLASGQSSISIKTPNFT